MKAIVGLGNPGPRYELTRHNIGFLAVDALAEKLGLALDQEKFRARMAKGNWAAAGGQVVLSQPQTFMNNSGESVGPMLRFFQMAPSDCLVVHDEIDLPFGRVRFKQGGGDGGHNGLKSVTASLGTPEYLRVRLGVGRPAGRQPPKDYVLSRFEEDELDRLGPWLEQVVSMVEVLLKEGLSAAQNRFHSTVFGAVPTAEDR